MGIWVEVVINSVLVAETILSHSVYTLEVNTFSTIDDVRFHTDTTFSLRCIAKY